MKLLVLAFPKCGLVWNFVQISTILVSFNKSEIWKKFSGNIDGTKKKKTHFGNARTRRIS